MSFRLPPFRRAWCAAAIAALSLPTAALAIDDLDTVVVTGTREGRPLSESAHDIVLIDQQQLIDSGVDSIEEALRRFAGVQLARNGGPGQSGGYFVRGVGSSGTIVMIDGVRVGSATLGQFDFSALSAGQIDRIEVLRGPASGLYGADAVGGVIHVITRQGRGDPRLHANLGMGNYRAREAGIGFSGATDQFDYAFGVNREKNRGVSATRADNTSGNYNPDDDGYKRTVSNARVGFTPVDGHRVGVVALRSKLNAQYDSAEYNAPDFTADATPDFRNHLDTSVTAIDYRGQMNGAWATTVRLANSVDESNTGGATMNRYKTDRDQWTWQNVLRLNAAEQLVLAYEHLKESVSADQLGSAPERTNKAMIAGYVGQHDQTGWEANIRRDDNSAYGKKTTGSLGFNYSVEKTTKFRLMYGTSFRAPTYNDLYYPGYGVSTLKPEQGRSIEMGFDWRDGSEFASFTLYRNKLRDMIGYDSDSTGTSCPAGYFGCASNTDRAKLKGATLALGMDQAPWRWQLTMDWLSAKNQTTGERLPRRARHQAGLEINYVADDWRVGLATTRVGARPDGDRRLKSYTRFDLTGSVDMGKNWRIEGKLLNATDRDIEPVAGYRELGRQAWVGVRIDTGGI